MTILGLNLGPHADFIIASYAVAAIVVVLLIAWVAFDYIAQKRRLARLERQGVTRHSEHAIEKPA